MPGVHAFDVLGDPVRRRILELLADGEQSAGAVCEVIQEEFGISQPAVSQHLRVLRDNGFATMRPAGARRLYAVNDEPLREVDAWLDHFRRFWTPPLEALAIELARGRRQRRLEQPTTTGVKIMIDVKHQISEVRREIGSKVLEAGEARVITVSQTYRATVEDVWDACTSPERIQRWFLPVSGDLQVGGRYQLEGNASGTVERCDPPHSFAATWEFGGESSWIEVRLSEQPGGRTQLELEHVAHVTDELWAQFGPGAVGIGWDLALMGLAQHLSTGESVDPQEAAAWSASAEGREFISLSSEQWAQASITAGTPAAEAHAAAERTTGFYTGADPAPES